MSSLQELSQQQHNNQQHASGSMHHIRSGPRVLWDASLQVAPLDMSQRAEIGVVILCEPNAADRTHLQIQAAIPHPGDPLKAEAQAGILAIPLTAHLLMQNITFMTDSETIVHCFDMYTRTGTINQWKLR